ncbi:hypothetical protein CVIRNUC_002228 [Coccomyxa viridis]|uniref:PhoD-like phosphatase domain-containing protein n=1 Tax=Coccomyxa viridis TaxID=1274662 RepID=A0AAV1HVB1_9CHLO|nr:hypothetical protein CVIRNUC_002228 [Coccomyxa viridis]
MQNGVSHPEAAGAVSQAQQHDSSSIPGHAARPPQAPGLVSKAENPLSGKASAVAAASKGDNCTLIPSLDEKLTVSGPYIVLLGCDSAQCIWRASVMIVTPPARGAVLPGEPSLMLSDQGQTRHIQGLQLDELAGWKFWRFNLEAVLGDEPRTLEYSITADQIDKSARYAVALAAKDESWRWGFHSCNGLSAGADVRAWKDPHLWEDVMATHAEAPIHAFVGGGDQIYNDALWSTPSMQAWLHLDDSELAKPKLEHDFNESMQREVTEFLFNHYRVHFQSRPALAQAYARIPQINQWDDHDIFDGWGSYPDHLLQCPVFQGTYKCCRRFFLLFQHHTTPKLSGSMNGLFGPPGTYSWCRQLGPRVAIVAPDCRAERTVRRVISPEAYQALFAQIAALPPSVKHLVVCTTVPVVFPKLPLSELAMTAIEDLPFLKGALQKTGLAAGIIDKFGHADLLDDIIDHWDARAHLGERAAFVERLQQVTKAHGARVSFVSGDVHVGGVGRLYTRPKMAHLTHDHRYMPQIVSSAMWNCPPPSKLITLLERTNRASKVTHHTQEKMVRAFQGGRKLVDARNWCLVEELPYTQDTQALKAARSESRGGREWVQEQVQAMGSSRESIRQQKTSGALLYTLRVEDPTNQTAPPQLYKTYCPLYIHSPLRNHVAVRRSSFIQSCMCYSNTRDDDPLEEL